MVQSQEKLPHTSQHDTKVNQNCLNLQELDLCKSSKMIQFKF